MTDRRADTELDIGRRRLRVFVLGVVALVAFAGIVHWFTGRVDQRAGSVQVSGPPLTVTSVANSYHAVYRVENWAGSKLNVTTERTWVRRPFESRIETWKGSPGTERLSVRQSAFGVLTNLNPRSQPLRLGVGPSLASGDVRFDAVLREALARHVIQRRERRRVYKRTCQVYRTGGPISAGDVTRYVQGSKEYADVCLDRHGLVLEEAWYSAGKLLRRRVAVEIEADPAINDSLLSLEVPESAPDPRYGAVKRIPPDQAGAFHGWVIDPSPDGFQQLGRYAVVYPTAALPSQNGITPSQGPISTSDVFARGPDLLVVDQDPSLALITQADTRANVSLDIKGFKSAVLILDARMCEVRLEDDQGSVVRIYGTLAPSDLIRFAQSIVKR